MAKPKIIVIKYSDENVKETCYINIDYIKYMEYREKKQGNYLFVKVGNETQAYEVNKTYATEIMNLYAKALEE